MDETFFQQLSQGMLEKAQGRNRGRRIFSESAQTDVADLIVIPKY